ncbi:MAG: hypothetical protein R3A47_03095 [Polyangiales bacterium]
MSKIVDTDWQIFRDLAQAHVSAGNNRQAIDAIRTRTGPRAATGGTLESARVGPEGLGETKSAAASEENWLAFSAPPTRRQVP